MKPSRTSVVLRSSDIYSTKAEWCLSTRFWSSAGTGTEITSSRYLDNTSSQSYKV
uniref:TIDP3536 n=1 Tax=Arundo donax TaxID=35708 RepID=A0A0A9GI62_ARUDO